MKMQFKTICQRHWKPRREVRTEKEKKAGRRGNRKCENENNNERMNYELIRARPEGLHNLPHRRPLLWSSVEREWKAKMECGIKMIVYVKFGTRHAYNKPQESWPRRWRADGDEER